MVGLILVINKRTVVYRVINRVIVIIVVGIISCAVQICVNRFRVIERERITAIVDAIIIIIIVTGITNIILISIDLIKVYNQRTVI